MRLEWRDQIFHLLAQRALWWPERRTLIVADLHWGKDTVFRQSGLAVPEGTLAADLQRLDELITRYQAERLLILGDLVHSAPTVEDSWAQSIARWRRRHQALTIAVVNGNHDRRLGPWLNEWGMQDMGASCREAPFVWRHEPSVSDDGYVIAGHLHPAVAVRIGRRRQRLPVFWFGPDYAVLPAFGSFTGQALIQGTAQDRIYAVVNQRVVAVPVHLTTNRYALRHNSALIDH
ncbi:MAG: ligase-associated DNA damage response endonuclease PdeM [Wenzhouxiangellaceae bacterium]